MSETKIPGTYKATVKDYGLGKTKAGDPQVLMLFAYVDPDGHQHTVNWYGSLKEGQPREITLKSMLNAGFKGNDLIALTKEGAFDPTHECEIVTENNEYNGKTTYRVQYVNEVGGSHFREKLDSGEAAQALGGLNIGGDLAALRQKYAQPDKSNNPGF